MFFGGRARRTGAFADPHVEDWWPAGEAPPPTGQMAAPTLYCCFFRFLAARVRPTAGRACDARLACLGGIRMCLRFRLSRSDSERGVCRQCAGRCCDRSARRRTFHSAGGIEAAAGCRRSQFEPAGAASDRSRIKPAWGAGTRWCGGRPKGRPGRGWQHLMCSRR